MPRLRTEINPFHIAAVGKVCGSRYHSSPPTAGPVSASACKFSSVTWARRSSRVRRERGTGTTTGSIFRRDNRTGNRIPAQSETPAPGEFARPSCFPTSVHEFPRFSFSTVSEPEHRLYLRFCRYNKCAKRNRNHQITLPADLSHHDSARTGLVPAHLHPCRPSPHRIPSRPCVDHFLRGRPPTRRRANRHACRPSL